MMRSGNGLAVAVRRPDQAIVVRRSAWRQLARGSKLWRRPFLRGGLVLVETLVNGIAALNFSAEVALVEEKGEQGDAGKSSPAPVWFTVTLAVALALGLFVALPHMAVWLGGKLSGRPLDVDDLSFHLIVGVVKLGVFVGYLALISLMKDIRRLFAYHGAEHQSIHALEAGQPLDVAHAAQHPPMHPRCGTTFLIMVVAVSILVFALVFPPLIWLLGRPTGIGWLDQVIYVIIKLPLLVPIAGLAYELQRLTARHQQRRWARLLAWPGLFIQRLTTRRPSADQLEVALSSLLAARQQDADPAPAGSEPRLDVYEDFAAARLALGGAAAEAGDVRQAG